MWKISSCLAKVEKIEEKKASFFKNILLLIKQH